MARLLSLMLMLLLLVTRVVAHEGTPDAEKLGHVHFATSCSAEAQTHFDRAVALLHSFWFAEATKAFNTVLETDSSCTMGYWGLAMSLLGNPLASPPPPQALQEGAAILRQAKPVGVRTEREAAYLAAIGQFYKDVETADHRTRALAYEQAMERLADQYPNDSEAAVFYALALNITAQPSDKTYANQLKAAAILEKVLAQQPQHPGVAHYLIHSYDYPPIAEKGLPAARSYASIAPAAPHALHMPSHIFTRLGLWQESITTNRASAQVANNELSAATGKATGSYNALHAMDYMMYGHLQLAQDQEAKKLRDTLLAIGAVDVEQLGAAFAFAAVPARYALERRQWEEASTLTLHPKDFNWARFPQAESVLVFARGIGAARTGKAAAAQQEVARLQALRDALVAAGQSYWAEQAEIQRQVVQAWATYAAGKPEDALKLMRQAVAREDATEKHPVTPGPILPARELLGDLLLTMRQPAQSLQAFEASHRVEPNRFQGWYGAARAAALAGEQEKARAFYGKLVALAEKAEGERPEVREAKAFLARP